MYQVDYTGINSSNCCEEQNEFSFPVVLNRLGDFSGDGTNWYRKLQSRF